MKEIINIKRRNGDAEGKNNVDVDKIITNEAGILVRKKPDGGIYFEPRTEI
jgi:hypothetical protein